jgi:uncharacterized SAM-binding protein YcdF (DUF218 family)
MIGFAFRVAALVFVLAALGFPIFVWSLPRTSADPGTADGIVALTGGEGRLPAAFMLLDQGKGQRLLISGVDAEVTRAELYGAAGAQPTPRTACCVDLGRSAESTIGNASETVAWVNEHNYRSIIVVTAAYHMPRSMMELHAAAPYTQLVAYPVFPDGVRLEDWWRDPSTTGVLAWEYVKYLGSGIRVAVATRLWTRPAPLFGPVNIEHAPGATSQLVGAPT